MKKERLHQLYLILASSGEWHLASDLAFRLHTTTRTIRNYVDEINRNSDDGPLIISSFRGYRWNPAIHQTKVRAEAERQDYGSSSDERYWYILRRIILERVNYGDLIDDLFISESTIDGDLQKVRELARRHGVRLRRVRDRLFLNGRRSDIRKLSFLCVMQFYSRKNVTTQIVKDSFPMYNCKLLYEILNETLEKYCITTNAYADSTLFLLVMLQYWDVMHGTDMTESESVISDIHEHIEFDAAMELALLYKEKTGADYNKWEIEYLAAVICSMTEPISGDEPLPFADDGDLYENTIENLHNASIALGVDLLENSIVNRMMSYIQRLIIRSKMGFIIRDLTFQSVKSSHPVVQDVSAWILIFTARQHGIQIDRNEVGFLAKFLCGLVKDHLDKYEMTVDTTLICPSFGDFPHILVDALTTRLGESVKIHKVIDSAGTEDIDKSRAELFLSVVPVPEIPHCVNISLYPRSADYRHIYTELHRIKMKAYCERLAKKMEHLLCPEIVVHDSSAYNGDQIVKSVCYDLQRSGFVREGFMADIAERENMDPSVYSSNIALPHVYSESVIRNFVQIALFPKPVVWDESRISILCIIGIIPGTPSELYDLFDLCIKVLSNQHIANALLRAYDRKSFLEILQTIDLI